jgi:hypothetical protein
MAAFPALAHSGRADRPEDEAAWRLAPVPGHLAGDVPVRRADRSGTVSIDNRNRYVGRALSGRDVSISLDPLAVGWVYGDRSGSVAAGRKPRS